VAVAVAVLDLMEVRAVLVEVIRVYPHQLRESPVIRVHHLMVVAGVRVELLPTQLLEQGAQVVVVGHLVLPDNLNKCFQVAAVVEPVLTLWASRLLLIRQSELGKALHLN
jgi:heptaprenylglyceryl phosphate synthase